MTSGKPKNIFKGHYDSSVNIDCKYLNEETVWCSIYRLFANRSYICPKCLYYKKRK